LKCQCLDNVNRSAKSLPPRGARIEMTVTWPKPSSWRRRSPRGERGLKSPMT